MVLARALSISQGRASANDLLIQLATRNGKSVFPKKTVPSLCTCVTVFVYLPKSLVHTAIRTSSSEHGLQVTKMENMKTFSTFTKEKNTFFLFSMIHFLWPVAFVSSCDFCHAYSASCSLFLFAYETKERHQESMWMRTAGEGVDVITELPLDPVSYKNSYKPSRHTDTHTHTGFLLSH